MKTFLTLLALFGVLALSACASGPTTHSEDSSDPYLWLEEVEGKRALEWVKKQNERTLGELESDPRYPGIVAEVRAIAEAKDKIPYPSIRNGFVYNFWQDAEHVKGLWRRTTLDEYRKPEPAWETLLDIDELSRKENVSWVWKGSNCFPPQHQRCLLTLSKGGKDASVIREFDLPTKSFVVGGFELPEAKSRVSWLDESTILVGTDFGPGSMTSSGYPAIVKVWGRGLPLSRATTIFEGKTTDLSASGFSSFRPEGNAAFVNRQINFYEAERYLVSVSPDRHITIRSIPLPRDAIFEGVMNGLILAKLRSEWRLGQGARARTFPEGSLVSLPLRAENASQADLVYAPEPRTPVLSVELSRDSIYVNVLSKVNGKILKLSRRGSKWVSAPVPLPSNGTAFVWDSNNFESLVFFEYESFLTPPTLSLWDERRGGTPSPVRSLPARFDATGMKVRQEEAVSRDGTKIPYFLVLPAGPSPGKPVPVLQYGYGGFEDARTPHYLGSTGKAWVEKGGAYVLANIRGGGEFGPSWHRSALKENRQRCFDDFIAVSEDLIRKGVTTPRQLGIMGGSNGGLLVSAVLTQRPDLYQAVVSQVPLTDMLRFHKLLAGASWMAEYGNPDEPAQRAYLEKYSPYQNARADRPYPQSFFYTSTRDDRVHPGHARKMAARLLELGQPVLYYENIEGGHNASADLEQRIRQTSRDFTYLFRRLK